MLYELSATFAKVGSSAYDFQEIWTRLCYDLLAAVFPSSNIVRMDSDEYGADLLDQTTGTAYCCHSVDEPSSDTLSVDGAMASLERAARYRGRLGWNRYNIATNTEYSEEGMTVLRDRIRKLQIAPEDVGFLGPATWNRLSSEYPRVVDDWFDYRVLVSKDAVKKAFEKARYYPKYVAEYSAQIDESDFNVVLTNNRTPVELVLPFSPQLSVKHLLEIGKVLFDLSLDTTDFRDLGTSARLSLSVVVNEVRQVFSTLLTDVPIPSGGEAQIWIQIIWKEKSFDPTVPDDGLPHRDTLVSNKYISFFSVALTYSDYSLKRAKTDILGRTPGPSITPTKTASPKEQTLARKTAIVSARIWQKAKGLLPTDRTVSQPSDAERTTPVRLGASAPKVVAPASSFAAHFVAYHPDLEAELTKQLNQWNPEATHRLDAARTNWKINTRVKVKVYGEDFVVDREADEFCWGGEKHILDFRVKVDKHASGPRDLKFDVYVEDLRLSRIWMPVEVSNNPDDTVQRRTVTSPRTAFASYSSKDRLRVLDRVATLEIHCGLRVFLDCVTMRPNAKWRDLLPEMVVESDLLLLFWSKAARDSRWVNKEWRIAFDQKGIDGIEIHPLSPYEEAALPKALADLVHGTDPMMLIRAYEERVRSGAREREL